MLYIKLSSMCNFFFFSSRRRHTRCSRDWSSDVCSSGLNGRTLHWSLDGRWLFDTVAKQGRTPLVRVDAQSGAVTEITHGDQAVLDFSVTPDARALVALGSTPVTIGDLFTIVEDGTQRRITDLNQSLWS